MSKVLFSNNATSTIAGAISPEATTVSVASGTGALFPAPTGAEYFVLSFTDQATGLLHEIVHVTAVTSDTFTIVRAQEGTAAQSWNAGDLAQNLCTAGTMQSLMQQAGNFYIDGGTANAIAITLVPAPTDLAALVGVPLYIQKSAAANTGAVTIDPSGLGAAAATNADGSALVAGQLPANAVSTWIYNGTAFQLQSVSTVYADINGSASEAFSMTTAAVGTNTTQGATTAFVQSIPHGSQLFTASGTFTVPTGVAWIEVEVLGGGGSGGGVGATGSAAGGGGAGGYSKVFANVVPGTEITVTVGAGGAAAGSGGGNPGGTSSFGSINSATGGQGGGGAGAQGGIGGVGSGTGAVNGTGAPGSPGVTGLSGTLLGGTGGSSAYGGGGLESAGAGIAATGYGAGGGGAGSTVAADGGAGTGGLVYVRW